MTERRWLTSTSPHAMLSFLRDCGLLSRRKTRLYAAACCRQTWNLFTDEHSRRAVAVAEWDVDGLTNREAVRVAERGVAGGVHGALMGMGHMRLVAPLGAARAALTAGRVGAEAGGESAPVDLPAVSAALDLLAVASPSRDTARGNQAGFLRDLFGPLPFRPPALPPSLLTANIVNLAQAAYEERHLPSAHLDTSRLAVLADALEEAGCCDAALLGHLRSKGPHVRGCAAVDLILGRG
jgi:hypothetical protein